MYVLIKSEIDTEMGIRCIHESLGTYDSFNDAIAQLKKNAKGCYKELKKAYKEDFEEDYNYQDEDSAFWEGYCDGRADEAFILIDALKIV